jgi:hypothetical protein
MAGCNVDCHAHIIDQRRFPVLPGRGYKPKPDDGTSEELAATIDARGIARFPAASCASWVRARPQRSTTCTARRRR